MNTSPSADGPEPIPFSRWLREHGAGHLDDRLTATMREVIDAVVLHEKSGTVTLALDIVAEGDGVVVTPKITFKVPTPKERGRFYYVTDAGLSLRDPAQPSLFNEEEHPNV